MSHLHVLIITLADDAEGAMSEVSFWMDEYADREFFNYGRLNKPEQVCLVKGIVNDLERLKAEVFQGKLPAIEMEIQQAKDIGDRPTEGYHHIRYGRILCEQCCEEMPFFNITANDWSIPTEVPEDVAGMDWYAVLVDLQY